MEAVATAKSLGDLWPRIDAFLRSRVRSETHAKFFAPLRAVGLEGDRPLIAAPDLFHRDFVEDNYRGFFEEFVSGIAGFTVRVVFVVDESARAYTPTPVPAPTPVPSAAAAPAIDPREIRPNSRYTFDTFVVGESNRFAFAATQAVAANPGKSWNPLFIHGDSGGKTHLLHAVAHAILEKAGGGRVAIVSSERYTNDFVDAIKKGTLDEFRRKYRECSAFIVDDVQFLAGKEKTAEEFFHTFNDLHDHHVQIVLSSDRPPKDLKGLDERLCSRFEWGMRVQIEPPEFETRAAILKKKAELEGIVLPDDVTDLLATHIRSNVRADVRGEEVGH